MSLLSTPAIPIPASRNLEDVFRVAQAHWKDFVVSTSDFMRCLEERHLPDGTLRNHENATDLYLVCACLRGVPAAIRTLELQYLEPAIPASAMSVGRDDLRQTVLERLLLRNEAGHCRLEEYSGRSSLRSWLRVVCKRVYLNLIRGQSNRPTRELDDALQNRLVAAGSDPELDYFRLRYADEFKRAFRLALEKLEPRELLMLKMHLVEHASGAAIASLFGVNRATVVRWMADTRRELLIQTRQHLQRELSLSRAECDSVVRLVMRQLDVSLSVLRDGVES